MGREEEEAAIRVIRSGHLTMGDEVRKFEEEFKEFTGAPYAIAVDSCTNALWLCLRYIKEMFGQQNVEIPAMDFTAVAHTIVQNGHVLVLNDVYHAGEKYPLKGTNIWDSAHECRRGMYLPGQVMCFSFYPNKVLSSCEGGMIILDDEEEYEWLKSARWSGRVFRTFYDYDVKNGWKMNMTDMQAAIAREQLKKLDGFNARRDTIMAEYEKTFKKMNRGNYIYVIEVKNRPLFMQKMKEAGIETSYHYKPIYEQPAYLNYKKDFPYTESIKNGIVSIPLYPDLKDDEVQEIIKQTKLYQNVV